MCYADGDGLGSHSCSTRTFLCSDLCRISLTVAPRTTYIGQVMAYELDKEPDHDLATRTGAFAMLIYSLGMTLRVLCQVSMADR